MVYKHPVFIILLLTNIDLQWWIWVLCYKSNYCGFYLICHTLFLSCVMSAHVLPHLYPGHGWLSQKLRGEMARYSRGERENERERDRERWVSYYYNYFICAFIYPLQMILIKTVFHFYFPLCPFVIGVAIISLKIVLSQQFFNCLQLLCKIDWIYCLSNPWTASQSHCEWGSLKTFNCWTVFPLYFTYFSLFVFVVVFCLFGWLVLWSYQECSGFTTSSVLKNYS